MYSGKTTELIRRLEREKFAGRSVLAFKPAVDHRYDLEAITTHGGWQISCWAVKDLYDVQRIAQVEMTDVIGIDEVSLFAPTSSDVIDDIVAGRHLTIMAGLDMTYRQEPFGMMPYLMAVADDVTKLKAVCHVCGEDAKYTQRLVEGKPASFDGPTIEIGGIESYEARCAECFQTG